MNILLVVAAGRREMWSSRVIMNVTFDLSYEAPILLVFGISF